MDRIALERFGLSGLVLMENAGLNAALALLEAGPIVGEVCILCGGGNNGGDGYVVARQLATRGVAVACFATHPAGVLSGDVAVNRRAVDAMGIEVADLSGGIPSQRWAGAALLVDGLLGTGFSGGLREPAASVIQALNAAGAPIASLDLPSGLDADTGLPAEHAVRAHRTFTFVGPKAGFSSPGARAYTGLVSVLPIGVPLEAVRLARGESLPGEGVPGTG